MRTENSYKVYNRQQQLICSQQSDMVHLNSLNSRQFSCPYFTESKSIKFEECYTQHTPKQSTDANKDIILSDLSRIIYQGLDDARKKHKKIKLIEYMESTFKKQLQIEIQLCKQLSNLTLSSIIQQNNLKIKYNVNNIYQQIYHLQSQIQDIQNHIYQYHQKSNITNSQLIHLQSINKNDGEYHLTQNTHDKHPKIKQKNSIIQCQNSTNQKSSTLAKKIKYNICQNYSTSSKASPKCLRPSPYTIKTKQSENFSVGQSSPSFISSSRITSNVAHARTTSSPSKPFSDAIEKKALLTQRKDVIAGQVELAKINFDRKTDMLKLQMDLLRKQIMLVDEQITQIDSLGQKKSCMVPFCRKKQENINNQPQMRSPKWLSYDRMRKSPRRHIFGFKNKSYRGIKNTRPSMFAKLKHPNPTTADRNNSPNSPNLDSCQSEHKYLKKYSYLQNQVQNSELKQVNKNNKYDIRNEYFQQKSNGDVMKLRYINTCYTRMNNNYYC